MGINSPIEWCHHTFNPWWGCTRVSPGCEHCYAETFAKRTGHPVWGPKAARRVFGNKHWAEPIAWNVAAARAGERHRVFCASMADVYEDRADIVDQRAKLFALIAITPSLDWLLLTKRPENMERLSQPGWMNGWPRNVWAGCTVEDQERADERIPRLLSVPATVRFLSCEPLLGRVDLNRIDATKAGWRAVNGAAPPTAISAFGKCQEAPMRTRLQSGIDWVIVGGESGPGARPFNLPWARGVIEQCKAAGVPCFVKQLGGQPVIGATYDGDGFDGLETLKLKSRKGGDIAEWPADLHVREFPRVA